MSKEGPKSESEADKLDRLIGIEEGTLKQLGFDLDNYKMPQLHYQCRIVTLERMLIQSGIIEQEPTTLMFKQIVLEELTELREAVEKFIEHQKEESRKIMLPNRDTTLYGPTGQPL